MRFAGFVCRPPKLLPQSLTATPTFDRVYRPYLKRMVQDMSQAQAAELKVKGNAAVKAFKLDTAFVLYSAAIAACPEAPVFCSKRSAALYEAGRYAENCQYIERALELKPDSKLAAKLALRAARCSLWQGLLDAAEQWLAHDVSDDPTAELKDLLASCRAAEPLIGENNAAMQCLAGANADAPGMLRTALMPLPGEMSASSHDPAKSLLEGVPPPVHLAECARHQGCYRQAQVLHASVRACIIASAHRMKVAAATTVQCHYVYRNHGRCAVYLWAAGPRAACTEQESVRVFASF